MGIQQIRGILPESIDDYLNVAINEKCRSVLQQNASTQFRENLSSKNNPVSPVNSLSTLYHSDKKGLTYIISGDDGCKQVSLDYEDVFEYISFFAEFVKDGFTWHRPCRIIEFDKLPYVLSDYCNKPDNDYPIICLVNEQEFVGKVYMENYDNFKALVYNYIAKPAKVDSVNNVDCNLPEYLHVEIVELAVQKFFQSIGSTAKQV